MMMNAISQLVCSARTGMVRGAARAPTDAPVLNMAVINGGGTVTVTAKDQKLPNLTIKKLDKQNKQPVAGTSTA